MESPEQSPFELWSRHPGEWGAVDSDLHTDHCELISSDEELSVSTTATATAPAARENTETLRYCSIIRVHYSTQLKKRVSE